MNKLLTLWALITLSVTASAQKTITGQVLEKDTNEPLLGVSVLIKGTNKGTSSDFDGGFKLQNVNKGEVMVFSYIGYTTYEITINEQDELVVYLEPGTEIIDEVVITALDIQRDKASLGYSVDQLQPAEFAIAQENNIMNSLSGKVSGLQITQGNTGVDGSSRILLRGVTTINGNNRPLIVIDGIPVSNASSSGNPNGGRDSGDALSDINPDDVASVTVLKGAGAAAAYGSLGMHGVILVTTKSGVSKRGIGVTVTSSFNITEIALTPRLQNEYGMGAFDAFSPVGSDGRPNLDYPGSWSYGPKMEGQTYTNWLGQTDTYSPRGNPYKEFYQKGYSLTNGVSFEGTTDKSAFRLSITNQNTQGIIPNNTLKKNTVNFRASSNLTEKLKIDGKVTYIKSHVKNRPELGEGASNTALQLSLMPRDVRLSDAKNNTVDANGNEIKWNLDNTFNNPYWALNNVFNEDHRDRFQSAFSAKLDISDAFYITGKTGLNYVVTEGTEHAARGGQANYNGLGGYSTNTSKSSSWNSDILATYTTNFLGFNATASVGANYRSDSGKSIGVSGRDEKVPNFYRISNYAVVSDSDYFWEKTMYSFYGLGQISYGGYLYLDATIRNDNSSALPAANDSYWYHSENLSFLFSKFFGLTSNMFNKGKIRASYAKVGNDTSPYRTQSSYSIDQTRTLDYTVASIPGSIPNPNLRPEVSHSWELGTELGFFKNRIHLDFTYYETLTEDQIMSIPISGTTGFGSYTTNAGAIKNKGYEAQLNIIPIETENFSWDMGVSITKSNSIVKSIDESVEAITLNSLMAVSVEARPGEEFGSIYGLDYLRDNFGRKLITNAGLAQPGERIKLGSINPDYYGGISNNFKYKNFSLRTLVSYQKGGEFFSWGRGYRQMFGTDATSLIGRVDGIVEDGINEHTGFENTVAINPLLKNYTNNFVSNIRTDLIFDASNVRMKEIALTYNIPKKALGNSGIQGVSISATGRNLFFIYNAAEDIDPEASNGSSPTATALEHASLPSTRTYGINVNINF
ncbi:SusC/RagA family TonB-linked outer membrane protein [Snuella sedimenti]|uniref:SusC/RagA family TonB-linked outer membrane protein n=1 Tax=Snuella sedimenti TaxID=2798802 RepID=A0A8J7IRR1_9FLAO|nr:SusC/RagA family TonB-linked outer membrane protein [Snuella sedimenti]MBJ6366620.1 SusC/RagA family TonB-linked outer membrane protein [Snuella sedimenti]